MASGGVVAGIGVGWMASGGVVAGIRVGWMASSGGVGKGAGSKNFKFLDGGEESDECIQKVKS